MNSAAKSLGILFCAGLALLLGNGCADRGPTNLYSKPLFNQSQAGAQMEIDPWDYNLTWPGSGSTSYSIALKNIGNGSTVGPITGVLSEPSGSCSTITLGTAKFGQAGQVINPGDVVYGQPVSYVADFSSCSAGVTVTMTVTMSDTRGNVWAESFYTDGHTY